MCTTITVFISCLEITYKTLKHPWKDAVIVEALRILPDVSLHEGIILTAGRGSFYMVLE